MHRRPSSRREELLEAFLQRFEFTKVCMGENVEGHFIRNFNKNVYANVQRVNTRYRDIVTAVIYCYITTFRRT